MTNDLPTLAPMVTELPSVFQRHWPFFMAATAALVHTAHMIWPGIKAAYPWLKSEGGIKSVWGNIWRGAAKDDLTKPPPTTDSSKP